MREEWRDPLLTVLTLLLALLMFVLAPLEAVGFTGAQDLGFAIAVLVIGATVVLSGNPIAIVVLLIGIGLATTAAVLRLQFGTLTTAGSGDIAPVHRPQPCQFGGDDRPALSSNLIGNARHPRD